MSLLSAFNFDEGAGTTAEDVAGSRDITVVSGNWEATGHTNSALDGAGGVRTVPSHAGLETSSRTLMFWARAAGSVGSQWLVQFYITASDTAAWGIGWIGGNLFMRARVGGVNTNLTTALVDPEGWHHYALTYDGTTLRGYRDGTQFASAALTGTIDSANAVELTDVTSDLIDDLRFHDEALDQATIEDLMDTPVTAAPASQTVTPTGIASTSALGSPVVTTLATVTPTGVASTATVGTPALTASVTVAPAGVAPTSATGTPVVSTLTTLTPTGIASSSAAGTPSVSTTVTARPTGIASTTAVGSPTTSGPGWDPEELPTTGTLVPLTPSRGMTALTPRRGLEAL